MKTQACIPCAKRKVRCDKAVPSCSTCKRRKRDHCVYPDTSPAERIRTLEATIKSLDESTNQRISASNAPASQSEEITAETPVILQEEGRSIYLESEGWQTWINTSRLHGSTKPAGGPLKSIHTPGKHLPHAFEGFPGVKNSSMNSRGALTVLRKDALKLWKTFMRRVEPTIKISFEWTLVKLESGLADLDKWIELNQGERALALSSCLFGIASLSKEECLEEFDKPKASFLAEYRTQCEQIYSEINMLAIDDISTLKSLCLYMKAGIDTVTIRSLWSLMGLVCRSAEQLGVHRDGQILGLSPIDTEERRRLWWQLQHLDLIFAIKSGVTPMTFTADWDARLPLNIEDSDLLPESRAPPPERVGLTSLSLTLFPYWIINQQRKFRQKRLDASVVIDRSLLGALTGSMIDALESELNQSFLQYCDPIIPIQALLQISARAVICVLRLRRLHELRLNSDHLDDTTHDEYFNTCQQSLRYVILTYAQPSLKQFRWMADSSFGWHALIGLLVDMPRLHDSTKLKSAWLLLAELYEVTSPLMDLEEDRRRVHAATSVVATWDTCKAKPGMAEMEKPAFVLHLEQHLLELELRETQATNDTEQSQLFEPDLLQFSGDSGEPFNFNFSEIDWSFWDSLG